MAKLPHLGRRATGKAIPWLTYYEVARTAVVRGRAGWNAITPAEREKLRRIVGQSRGRPGAVAPDDRREVRRIVTKALKGIARV